MLARSARTGDEADLLTDVYTAHYRRLVGLAAFLLGDASSAEDIVQEAYVRVAARHRGGHRLTEDAPAYLRTVVVNLCRSSQRRSSTLRRITPRLVAVDDPDAWQGVETFVSSELVQALRRLPPRQREIVVLRYYVDLSQRETAVLLGVSEGTVKSESSKGLHRLRPMLEEHDDER